ncbi:MULTISPECIES: TetR/AcrR family transcriptional regulator [unclassified Sinorhizobium]|uniref:TetR/AcrR family transcriptional regulator n=1 Tax=unclassified Sinorhizobium TaxID=2613772 RepID=UPI003524E2E9
MARPREFDEVAVLDAASDIFWTKGFEATSTRELTERTGLTPSSIYAAFGDKRGLFRSALDHYLSRLHEKITQLKTSSTPGQAITGFFEDTIERSVRDAMHRGCMLVNSALEASPRDPDFREAISNELKHIEEFFRSRFAAGQESGEIPLGSSAETAAQQLLAVLLGIRVLARVRPERALMTGAAQQTLQLLGLPPLLGRGVAL